MTSDYGVKTRYWVSVREGGSSR